MCQSNGHVWATGICGELLIISYPDKDLLKAASSFRVFHPQDKCCCSRVWHAAQFMPWEHIVVQQMVRMLLLCAGRLRNDAKVPQVCCWLGRGGKSRQSPSQKHVISLRLHSQTVLAVMRVLPAGMAGSYNVLTSCCWAGPAVCTTEEHGQSDGLL